MRDKSRMETVIASKSAVWGAGMSVPVSKCCATAFHKQPVYIPVKFNTPAPQ